MRVGIGFDMHQLREGRRLVLGGVEIPNPRGLDGHSDADALTHAVIDALLGAAGAGDIGARFGTDAAWTRDIASLRLLEEAMAAVARMGYVVHNADATVVAEAPRLAPHIPAMCGNLARALRVDHGQVNVKATSAKLMGLIGAGEGIAAFAVISLLPVPPAGDPAPPSV
ncbi:MAG TPA: 2-C-methyl-D-erythritol 2,4-cyclodiphosphate synthase [Candidatus Sulfotelmatobacter sp.]|nr:2-C-methyl-D-erythritol 2,4-cyclodiphosphate synthase [Candidatus Sulfotelmatobacter sp.]